MRKMMFLALGVFVSANSMAAGSAPPSEVPGLPIDRAREHSKNIFRGARPEEEGTLAIQRFGISTIINLEDNAKEVAREKKTSRRLGDRIYFLPHVLLENSARCSGQWPFRVA